MLSSDCKVGATDMAIVYNADGVAGKVCNKCGEWKQVSEFNIYRKKGVPIGDGLQYWCKACRNIDKRTRRAANPELHRQKSRAYMASRRDQSNNYQRAWRDKNREKVRASGRAHQQTNREKLRVAAKKRRDSDLEHYRVVGRYFYSMNREKRIAYNRAYFKARPGLSSANVRARRNRLYRAEGSHTEAEWEALKAKYNYSCLRCGRREPEITLTRDHVIAITQGGSDWITNIQPLCHTCNSSKNNKNIDYRLNWQSQNITSSETSSGQ
jgi:5-methylcytosine-specific restriction endonuclease McrA